MRIAAADLGSNSFHLLVVQAHPDGSFDVLAQDKEMLRLGDVVSRTGHIPDERANAVIDCLRRFLATAESLQAREVLAYATAAWREADNSAELADRVREELGLAVRVISGRDEARLVFSAVRSSVVIDPAPALCLDLGGGSLEIIVGDAGGLAWSDSVRLGVARLTADCVRHDPLEHDDIERLRAAVMGVLGPIAGEITALGPRMLVGTSGTLCDLARLAAIHAGADTDARSPSLNQLRVARDDVVAVHHKLLAMRSSERRSLPGIDARRADLIAAGSVVLVTAMHLFDMEHLTVGEWALREGMVLDAIRQHDPADWSDDPRAMRRASVLSLARRCSWDETHGRQVARLAVELFDQTDRLHRLAPDDRELLHHAALLHDIGEHISVEGHHKHTAYLIQHGKLRGFSPTEVAILICVGRFHRRGDPKASFEPYGSLGPDDRRRVTVLCGLLRIADGLDRGHASVVASIDVELHASTHPADASGGARTGRVRIAAHTTGEADLERWGVRRKAELFEKATGWSVECAIVDQHRGDGAEGADASAGAPAAG